MALRNIVLDGDPILKKKCRPVTEFNDRLAQLLDDMAETMIEGDGLGLAGPQVGTMRRLFVALDEGSLPARADDAEDTEGEEGAEPAEEEEWEPVVMEFINPEIIEQGEDVRGYEGCLSFPGRYGAIARPKYVKVKAFDRFGNEFEYEAEGMMARCICHETDHLDGVTIEDLAEYFYDPETPHDLDVTITGRGGDDEDGEGEE